MLKSRGNVKKTETGWHLEIAEEAPPGYRLAQLDDYATLARSRFTWQKGATLSLRCRVSNASLPGTWGFGFWNDPFTVSLGLNGMAQRLPALPNCAWFFYASSENHLSFTSGKPSNGFIAQTFSAARIPAGLLAPGLLATPLLFFKPLSKWLRAILAAKLISEDAKRLEIDVTQWHAYRLRWEKSRVEFAIDGETVFETATSPKGPLGLVIWIDNQFAAWRPDGSLGMGILPNPHAWMEIDNLEVKSPE